MTGRRPPAPSQTPSRVGRRLLCACALAALAGACKSEPPVTAPSGPPTTGRGTRSCWPTAPAASTCSPPGRPSGPAAGEDVDAFMLEYRRFGRGGLLMEIPQGLPPARAAATGRRRASCSSAPARTASPGTTSSPTPTRWPPRRWRPDSPELRADAGQGGRRLRGTWPQDIGVSDYGVDNSNKPYWNFGCSTQATLAAQVADPVVDLVRGRQEGRSTPSAHPRRGSAAGRQGSVNPVASDGKIP